MKLGIVGIELNGFLERRGCELDAYKIGKEWRIRRDHFDEAIEAGKKAVELRPNDQIGWTSLSLFYNRAGNIKEAEAAGTKAKILSWGGKVAEE